MLRRTVATTLLVGVLGAAGAATAAAAANPNGTGPPNQSCQDVLTAGGSTPGHSAGSPGSVFNEPGFGSLAGGKGGAAYNNAGAPSQYDVACFQVTHRG
jgi:hypothetical protein